MSTGSSSGSKPRLDIFIPKKIRCMKSGLNGDAGAKTTDTVGQSSPPASKPQSTRETAQDSMNHNIVQMAHSANPRATEQLPSQIADTEWTKDQLRLLHKILTAKFQLADLRSEVAARASSGTAILQRNSSNESVPVRHLPRMPRHSDSALNDEVGKTDCSAAIGLADSKTGIMIADTSANGDTTSLDTASTGSLSQDFAAHRTECKSPGYSHRSELSTSDGSPTAVRHRRGTNLSSGQHHPKHRSDKPARSQCSHKSCRHNRSPMQSRRQVAEHSTQRTGQSSPARKYGRSPSKVKNPGGKHTSSVSPARARQALASTNQLPAGPSVSAAKHVASSKPKRQTRGGLRNRRRRRHRSPSRNRSPYLGSRAEIVFARPRSPYLAMDHIVDLGFMEGQRCAEGERTQQASDID